ncbi:CD48 antigen-like [Heptranchias perlo]|uniref:CD48 antigen-like n=1 Tax=Heptranchias perlo TaxID=212740 RepID=UPI0035597537
MWQLCAGRVWSLVCVFLFAICVGEIQTLRPPVNGTLGQSIVLPVGIPPTPEDVEVVWKRKEPDARIARYMNKNVETFGTEEYTGRIKFHPENYSLQISDLQREDSGVYEVIVTGALGRETSELVRLDVYERVSGTNITATVTQGICNITLTCSVTSGNLTSFRWWRGREELGNDSNHYLSGHGEELRIYYTSDVKESVYRCEAWNPVSNDTAQIKLSDVCNITVSGTQSSTATVVIVLMLVILLAGLLFILYKNKETICPNGTKRQEAPGETATVYAEVNPNLLEKRQKDRLPPEGDELDVKQVEGPTEQSSITVYDTIKNPGLGAD